MAEETRADEPVVAEPDVTVFPEPERFILHMPVDVRNVSLVILAIMASLFVLQWARVVLIPIMLSVLLSYAFSPLINWMETRRVPRWLSSAVLLLGILGAMGSGAYLLRLEATQLIEALPAAAQKLGQALRSGSGKSSSPLETVQKAAAQIEQATRESAAVTGPNRGATRVVIEAPRFNIKDYLWTGTIGLLALIGQIAVVVFLTYFLMLSGDTFRRKLVKLAGPSLSKKKITLQALHEIAGQIQRYLQVQLLTSLLVGVLTAGALMFLGLDNAAVWGVVACVLNLVPYIGSLVTAAASALVAFLQFGSINMAMAVGGTSIVIHTLVGNLLTPWLTSRASRLSPVAVFMGLLAWGWLWGVWGLLLGIPILMIVKSVCDRVEDLKPIGEFLGS
ncbi:AI-2E family transporter [Polaromonas sp. CG_9.11]|uniref:AI-2E family transporter n=1 Tax=Polaromonas sp. CG_9.11 TaxID=2787730 RepID=UPI0018CB7CDB|nr:AI-2E family transporter [Polaromonas sp. CG_9.11]MBG6077829.1 putative PurR-regulated permease PerM [Polaromonas sp. CG_9.11]